MTKKLIEISDEDYISGGNDLIKNFSISHCYKCSGCGRSFFNPTDVYEPSCPYCKTKSLSRIGKEKIFFNYARKKNNDNQK